MTSLRNAKLWALTVNHFINDMFVGALPILFAFQTRPLDLQPQQIGILALSFSIASSITQPLFGLLSDGKRAPLLAVCGALWTGSMYCLAGFADEFTFFLGFVTAAGLGSAAFHPPGAGGVPRVAEPGQRGVSTAVFLLGGTGGFAIGPLLASRVFDGLGSNGLWIFISILAIMAPILLLTVGRLQFNEQMQPDKKSPGEAREKPLTGFSVRVVIGVVLLMIVITCRMAAEDAIRNFLPQLYIAQGITEKSLAGNVLFTFSLAAAFGSLVFGFLADRIGRYITIMVSMFLAVPFLFGLLYFQGLMLFVCAAGFGFFVNASLSLTLLLGQEILPGRPGLMTGVTLGFTFISGGLGSALTGQLAGRFSLALVLGWMPYVVLAGAVAALLMMLVNVSLRRPEPASS